MDSPWFKSLSQIRSLGSQHEGVDGLAALHRARMEHLSQFFTPAPVVRLMWDIVAPAMAAARKRARGDTRVALFDNSIGAGGMFRFAHPDLHTLAGCDIHGETVKAVMDAAQGAGLSCDIVQAGMQDIRPGCYNVAFINPPFSIHLDSPNLEYYQCNTYGKFGPNSSCVSHAYALAQALGHAEIVVAVLPTTFADTIPEDPFFSRRLRLIADLPGNAFKSEGANVLTSIAVFELEGQGWGRVRVENIQAPALPSLRLHCSTRNSVRGHDIRVAGVDSSEPSITTPVTGNPRVRVGRHNRRLILKYSCGLVEAKVANAVLAYRLNHFDRPKGHRYPRGLVYAGEGKLDLQVYLMQDDPVAAFRGFIRSIISAGGEPVVCPGIVGYLQRQARKLAVHRVALGHTVRTTAAGSAADTAEVKPKITFTAEKQAWESPIFKKGTAYQAKRTSAGNWSVGLGKQAFDFTDDALGERFDVTSTTPRETWTVKHPGRLVAFPTLAHSAQKRGEALGLDLFLSWKDYQFADLCELAISPFGAAPVWEMGLGKARLAIALCLIKGGPRNLIVVEPHLVAEMVTELKNAPLSNADWQVISSTAELSALRKVNVITYNRLRLPLRTGSKRTYAHSLRNRISTMVCDEGHHLRNLDSDRTRSVWQVNARHRYAPTGTPIANYPRDSLNILLWLGGDGTASQHFGKRHAYLESNHLLTMSQAQRGLDVFRERFVTLVWAVNEFSDTLTEGAKREIPRINNLPQYRAMLAPFFKRRIMDEPDVSKYVHTPKAKQETLTIEWDNRHLGFYLRIAEEFAEHFREQMKRASEERRNVNLIALLARIGAVEKACNFPQGGVEGFGSISGLTSKQSAALERALTCVSEGHKTIVYAKSPELLERLAEEADRRGVRSVVVHGGKDIEARTQELNEQFRFGPVDLLFASLGCTQTGLNLWQASRVVFLSRDWRAITERQALARVLRPQQKQNVVCYFYHLAGSIDEYQAMMSGMKGDAADAGLDWATPSKSEDEFLHIDHILAKFCEGVAELRGVDRSKLREALAGAA